MSALLYRLIRAITLCSSLFLTLSTAWGQCPAGSYPNDPNVGSFTVPAKVCLGNVVTVSNVPADVKNPGYAYTYDGSSSAVNVSTVSTTTYTYTRPGSYTILQKANRANGTVACQVVQVVQPTQIALSARSCSGLTTTLSLSLTAENTVYDQISITWGDGASELINGPFTAGTRTIDHRYANTLSRTVTVRGQINGQGGCQGTPASILVTPQSGSTTRVNPVINTLTSSDKSIAMRYQVPSGTVSTEILRKDPGTSAFVSSGITSPTSPFTVAAPSDKVTCFQIVARDACGVESRSSEVCSLVLNAQGEDRQNKLNWIPYNGTFDSFRGYRVYRNSGAPIVGGLPLGQSSYTDAFNIQCGTRYCYRLEATLINPPVTPDQTIVTSAEACVTGVDAGTIAGPASAFVSVQGGGVYVKATLPTPQPSPVPAYTLVVARADRFSGPFADLGTSNDLAYTDNTARTGTQSYCYQTAIINKCGAKSPYSKPACTILLTAGPDGILRWTSESPFNDQAPGSYLIVKIDPVTGNPDDKFNVGKVSQYKPDPNSPITQYQVVAVDGKGIESYSNQVDVQLAPKLLVPDAFSPNGDAANDAFMPKGLFWNQFEMTLYDRWGGVVYNTTDKDAKGWSGDVNGQPAQAGYYTYRVKITDIKGQTFERTGRFLLIR